MREHSNGHCRKTLGFTLIEMLLALGILGIVMSVVVAAVIQMQQRQSAEYAKVDTVQESRDFIDQMVRDIHTVGYPPGRVLDTNPTCVGNINVSCGLVFFSSTQIEYEGDLDGMNNVYHVWLQLVPGPSGGCPCILRRGVLTKTQYLANVVPDYFTEVNGVLNSGNGAGAASYAINLPGPGSYSTYGATDVFDAFDVNANPVASCPDPLTCSGVRSVRITVNVTPTYADPRTKVFPVLSITSRARLNN